MYFKLKIGKLESWGRLTVRERESSVAVSTTVVREARSLLFLNCPHFLTCAFITLSFFRIQLQRCESNSLTHPRPLLLQGLCMFSDTTLSVLSYFNTCFLAKAGFLVTRLPLVIDCAAENRRLASGY